MLDGACDDRIYVDFRFWKELFATILIAVE